MTATDYFSQSYAEARGKFRSAAAAAGGDMVAHVNPHQGPAGEELAVDVARFGPADAAHLIWINSGTHGAEGFCGSGCQIGLLARGWARRLPADTALLLSHVLNPYGMAHLRRVNEDNVDLNRNFGDHTQPYPANPGYAELHDHLLAADPDNPAHAAALAAYAAKHGERGLHQAMAGGQHSHPDGLFYGGMVPTWSNLVLRALAERHLANAHRFCFIDIHTGLGPLGYGEPSYVGRETEEGFAEALDWFGPDVTWLQRGGGQSTPLNGHIGLPFMPWHERGITGPVIGLEFGTLPSAEVRAALRAEHALHRHGGTAEQAAAIKARLREVFYVDTPGWKAQVLARTEEMVGGACRVLSV